MNPKNTVTPASTNPKYQGFKKTKRKLTLTKKGKINVR